MNSGSLIGSGVLVDAPETAIELHAASGLPGLNALCDDWNALLPRLREARFYHQHAWQLAYLGNLERNVPAVRYFCLRRGARPIAIFPLRRTLRRVAGIDLHAWELPHEAHMDLCDALIARDENSADLLCELVCALVRTTGMPWDVLHLPKLLEGGAALRALQAAPLSFVELARSGRSMHFDCSSLDAALQGTSREFLRNLNRQRRKLDGRGRIEVALVREPAALEAALAEFLRIEASGWKGTGGCRSAIALHREIDTFYRELTARFGAERRCSINLLKLDGKAIAAHYALIDGRRMNLLKIAYDETYAAEGPGNRLLHEVLAWCCATPEIAELSLVTGPVWAVDRWKPQTADVWSAYVFNASPRGIAAYLAMRMKPLVAAARTLLADV
jgi:CelD/BcsL family acetyltransferase involved in cellulose biosynthesis